MTEEYYDDFSDKETTEDLVEDGEISPEEAGFMEGFEGDEKSVSCAFCKKIIIDTDAAIEKEIENEIYLFCSESCLEHFEKQREEDEF